MRFREHVVPASVDLAVEAIWTLEAEADPDATPQPVVPDGRAEVIVHFGDAFEREEAGALVRQPALLVAGQLDRPLVLRPTGRSCVLGVRLRPAAGPALLSVPASELLNQTIEADLVSRPLARWLTEVRERSRSLDDAVALMPAGLARLLAVDRLDPRISDAAVRIDRLETTSVETLAAESGMTRRQLERLFQAQVGLSPKRLMRIRRLQGALRRLDLGDAPPGAMTAAACGYADQAHFVRECRALAGFTPGRLLLARAELTGLFLKSG